MNDALETSHRIVKMHFHAILNSLKAKSYFLNCTFFQRINTTFVPNLFAAKRRRTESFMTDEIKKLDCSQCKKKDKPEMLLNCKGNCSSKSKCFFWSSLDLSKVTLPPKIFSVVFEMGLRSI